MKSISDKVIKFISKCGIIIEFILTTIVFSLVYELLYYKKYITDYYDYGKTGIIIFFTIIILGIIIIETRKNYKKIDKMWVIYAIPIGLAFLTFVLPGYVLDEEKHIVRAYDISNGNLISQRTEDGYASIYVPKQYFDNHATINNSYKTMYEVMQERTNYEDVAEKKTTTGVAFIFYLPASLAFYICRFFDINFFIAIYLARILNFIIFLISGYYSIKIIPFGKLVLLVYMCTPMCIHQAMGVSYDSLINSILIFFIAYNLYLFKTDVKIDKYKIFVYYLLSICIAFAKIAYAPLILLSLMIFNKEEISKNKKILFFISLCVITIVFSIFSYKFMTGYYEDATGYTNYNSINPMGQFFNIIRNPLTYIKTMCDTTLQYSYSWTVLFIGLVPGGAMIDIKQLLILPYVVILLISTFYNKEEIDLNKKEKILFLSVFLLSFIALLTGLYMVWTVIGANFIKGIHGRYFIPIIILILLVLKNKNKYIENPNILLYFIIVIYFVNINVINKLIEYFLR